MQLGVVLSGGQSRRMGRDKSRLDWQGKSLLQHAVELLRSLPLDDVVVSGDRGVEDLFPHCGPVGGIVSVISKRQMKPGDGLLVLPVDMPLLDMTVLQTLINEARTTMQACYYDDFYLPLYLFNQQHLMDKVLPELENGKSQSVRSLLQSAQAQSIPCSQPDKFLNVNRPQDWQVLASLQG